MSNKKIQVSSDGTTFYTLPGNQGDFTNDLNNVTDTVFGQAFQSQQPTIGQWNVTSNGILKGVAGYNATISKGGTPTTMTSEPTSSVSAHVYQITNAAHRVISYNDTLQIYDNAAEISAQVVSIDYLTGTVTLKPGYTVITGVTLTGKYIPMTAVAKAKSIKITQTQTAIDQTSYDAAQTNGGYRSYAPGLKSVALELGNIFNATVAWDTVLQSRGIVYVTIDLDVTNPGVNVARGLFKVSKRSQSGNQGAVEDEAVTLDLYVPDGSLVAFPFNWYIASGSAMNVAIQKILQAFNNQSNIYLNYLPSGVTSLSPADGQTGQVFPIDCTLTNSIDGINVYSFNFRGIGAPTPI